MKYERIEIQTENGTAWLDRLTPRQIIKIGDSLWSEKRIRLIQDLKDADIGSVERIKAIQDHEKKRGLMSEIMQYAMCVHGVREIIAEASKSETATNAEGLPDNFIGTNEESMLIALELLGVEIDTSTDDSGEKTKKKK